MAVILHQYEALVDVCVRQYKLICIILCLCISVFVFDLFRKLYDVTHAIQSNEMSFCNNAEAVAQP